MTSTLHSPVVVWLIILAVGLGTFGLRYSFIGLFGYLRDVPPSIERALKLVPPAILAALIIPEVVFVDGTLAVSVGNDRLIAAGIAALVAQQTQNMVATIGVGMLALWGLSLL